MTVIVIECLETVNIEKEKGQGLSIAVYSIELYL
jgi:hypothetical protein